MTAESRDHAGVDAGDEVEVDGPALLQGLAVCGRCGERMTIRYHARRGPQQPVSLCQKAGIEKAEPICQYVLGTGLDRAIGELLVEAVTPLALEVTLSGQEELQSRAEEADLAASRWSEPAMRPSWRNAATFASTPTTAWWLSRFRRTGT